MQQVMKTKIIVFALMFALSALLIQACSLSKQGNNVKIEPVQAPLFPVSALTLAFNQEVNAEIEKETKKNYQPSEKLVEKYGLIYKNDSIFITGSAKFMAEAGSKDLAEIAVFRGSATNGLYSVFLSFHNLNAFYKSKSISYFEIANLNNMLNK
jgi:hypothetical protein